MARVADGREEDVAHKHEVGVCVNSSADAELVMHPIHDPVSRDKGWNLLAHESLRPDPSLPLAHELQTAINVLKSENLLSIFYDWYLEKYRIFLSQEAIPAFWDNFSADDAADQLLSRGSSATLRLANAVDQLLEECKKWYQNPVMSRVALNLPDSQEREQRLNQLLQSSLMAQMRPFFHKLVLLVYSHCFRISRHLKLRKEQKENGDESLLLDESVAPESGAGCPVCGKETVSESADQEMTDELENEMNREPADQSMHSGSSDSITCTCGEILEAFEKMNSHVHEVGGVMDEVAQDAVTSVVLKYIEKYVRSESRGPFNVHSIDRQLKWVRAVVSDWMFVVYKEAGQQKELSEWLVHFAYEIFAGIRIQQLFDIIIEYPDSMPALVDLKGCLDQCFGFRSSVVETLRQSFDERLLHPGVATNDILTAYIQTIKALRLLDPTGVLLQLVCDPLKTYLKAKNDTVRCIITNLTDVNSELIPELVRGGGNAPEDAGYSQSDDENIVRNWKDWRPDPIDAAKAPKNTRSVRSSDIVSILVDVYESKDLFVEEYQSLLSQRFLQSFECNVDFERRNLELLTLKFGEADLHACEVMLADMTSCKRIDARINSGEIASHHFTNFAINCIIVSSQFWPEKFKLSHYDEGSNLILPEVVEQAIQSYTKAFETIKGSRTLHWKKNLGLVQLDLEFGERVIPMSVTPLQAVLISHFEEQSVWKIACLSSAVGVTSSLLRRKLVFWQNKGIIREVSPDEYALIEDQTTSSGTGVALLDAEEDLTEDSFIADNGNKERPEDEKFRVYYSYIENMLTNLSDMTLEKIHSTLQMFALQGPSAGDLTLPELRQFLESKVREGHLTYSAGYYKLSPH